MENICAITAVKKCKYAVREKNTSAIICGYKEDKNDKTI